MGDVVKEAGAGGSQIGVGISPSTGAVPGVSGEVSVGPRNGPLPPNVGAGAGDTGAEGGPVPGGSQGIGPGTVGSLAGQGHKVSDMVQRTCQY